ncbi:MAG: diguanylate cyclase [Chloroflexota bacterium]
MRPVSISALPDRAFRAFGPRRRQGPASSLLRRAASFREIERSVGVDEATRRVLLYVVSPLWLGAGLADWDRHRKTHIETTAGTRESVIHSIMMVEAGIPSMMGLFLEVNAGTLLTAGAALVAHQLTAIWDVSYAESRRRVTPTEQHIHSLLEVVPLMAFSFLAVLHWDQARALVGLGPQRADFSLRLKRRPLPWAYRAGLLAALGAFMALPYGEEVWRCLRVNRSLAPQPEPAIPPTETLRISADGVPMGRVPEASTSAPAQATTR